MMKLALVSTPARVLTAFLAGLLLSVPGIASAQTATGSTATGFQFQAWIDAVTLMARGTINEAGPALFALMALIGGVYFVWNRVRSLW